jgi:hypothetical protein
LDDTTWKPKRALKNAHDILSAFESKRTK